MPPAPDVPSDMPGSNGSSGFQTSRPASAHSGTHMGSDTAQFHAGSRVLYNRDGVPVKGTVAKLTAGSLVL